MGARVGQTWLKIGLKCLQGLEEEFLSFGSILIGPSLSNIKNQKAKSSLSLEMSLLLLRE